jgi:hypothetical protein
MVKKGRVMSVILHFTPWKRWEDRHSFENMQYPGVYTIAKSDTDLSIESFTINDKIVYFGMTNSKGGIKSRLNQFDNSLQTPPRSPGHGGADRMKYKYPDYKKITPYLFVAIWPIVCNVDSNDPTDLRKMGLVARLEYECFAQYCEKFGTKPEFNDHKQSPQKYTLTRKSTYLTQSLS